MARVTSEPKNPFKRFDFRKTSQKDLVFARSASLRLFGAPNESLRLITMYYMFKLTFGIKTTLLESLQNKKTHLTARFQQN